MEEYDDYLLFSDTVSRRPILSTYEYSGTLTLLANELYNKDDLSLELEDREIYNVIDPSELAFNLFNDKKVNAILNRDGEIMSTEDLYIQSFNKNLLENYFKDQKNKILDNTVKFVKKTD